ncbi:hypothetical protein, partial [Bosea sp. TAB14]|uniref:hypothetical protein n=1 Tax=Bosea sp. TAB14 TaxID=3237481 RepID=UPI003F90D8E4
SHDSADYGVSTVLFSLETPVNGKPASRPIGTLATHLKESDMCFRAGVLVLALCCSAQAQISPTGPPQNAPPAETIQPAPAQSEDEARQKLAASGYPDVRELARTSDGGWTAKALVNGRTSTVDLNPKGEVRSRD